MPKKIPTHYANLKVARDAPEAVIKAAYRALIQQHHPDKNTGSQEAQEQANRRSKLILEAYKVLSDPVKRAAHDAWIVEQEREGSAQDQRSQDEANQRRQQEEAARRQREQEESERRRAEKARREAEEQRKRQQQQEDQARRQREQAEAEARRQKEQREREEQAEAERKRAAEEARHTRNRRIWLSLLIVSAGVALLSFPLFHWSLEPEMVSIKGGSFQMGSPASEEGRNNDERQHSVTVKDFRIGKYEVTVGQFRRFVEATGYKTEAEKDAGGMNGCWAIDKNDQGGWGWGWLKGVSWREPNKYQANREEDPVSCVSWNDAMAYIEWLNAQTEKKYRLPTEAEWEYAARGGTQTARYWGENPEEACRYANVADTTKLPNGSQWAPRHECTDGYAFVAPVGRFSANVYGLHDMLGNVWEWTCSAYAENYDGSETRCIGKNNANALRVNRGGSCFNSPAWVRSALRGRSTPDDRDDDRGFRLAQGEAE